MNNRTVFSKSQTAPALFPTYFGDLLQEAFWTCSFYSRPAPLFPKVASSSSANGVYAAGVREVLSLGRGPLVPCCASSHEL